MQLQVPISIYNLDFVSHKYKCVIEVHEIIPYFDKNETSQSYYNKRRKILDENGYKKYNLLVI